MRKGTPGGGAQPTGTLVCARTRSRSGTPGLRSQQPQDLFMKRILIERILQEQTEVTEMQKRGLEEGKRHGIF